jgi:hypothetical protein
MSSATLRGAPNTGNIKPPKPEVRNVCFDQRANVAVATGYDNLFDKLLIVVQQRSFVLLLALLI